VHDEQHRRVISPRSQVDEVDAGSADVRDELRMLVQPCFA